MGARAPSSREEAFLTPRTFLVFLRQRNMVFQFHNCGFLAHPRRFPVRLHAVVVAMPVMVIEDNYKSGVEALPTSASVLVAHAGRYG